MKNKALIIIVLISFMIPLGAVNMAEANNQTSTEFVVKLQSEYSEDINNNQTDFKVDQFRSKTTFRPIKRKLRFRRAPPRCPGF
jgi:ABC-type transporter MlaC component